MKVYVYRVQWDEPKNDGGKTVLFFTSMKQVKKVVKQRLKKLLGNRKRFGKKKINQSSGIEVDLYSYEGKATDIVVTALAEHASAVYDFYAVYDVSKRDKVEARSVNSWMVTFGGEFKD